jgi:hypothetical protein
MCSGENDLLVSEDSDQFEIATERRDVALQGRHLVLVERLSRFQPGDIRLVDSGRLPDLDLGLAHSFAQRSKRQVNPALSPKASTEDSYRIRVRLGALLRCLAHVKNDTPCFVMFEAALAESHSKSPSTTVAMSSGQYGPWTICGQPSKSAAAGIV